ncbi:MAG: alcohol dehydrogenase family protein [Alphaproteobacteria bacterium]
MTVPTRMRAVVTTGHGGLDMLDYRDDVPVPVPAAGEVLIKVGACSINNTDINTRTGWYASAVRGGTEVDAVLAEAAPWDRTTLAFPRIQGADIAGSIVAVGGGVLASRVGERVLVDPWIVDPADIFKNPLYVGSERDGGYAEYVAVPSTNAHRVSARLSDVEWATFPCAYSTAENMLHRAGLMPGETLVITGASGGVGTGLIQIGAARGARVVAVTSAGKIDQARALGASIALPRDDAALAESIKAAAGPVDVWADVVGGAGFPALFDTLRPGARYVTSGAIAGPIIEVDLRTLYLRDITMYGATMQAPEVFPTLLKRIEQGAIKPIVAKTYPLSRAREAQADFGAKAHVGKIVLVPGQ